jgi:hypothetical protein
MAKFKIMNHLSVLSLADNRNNAIEIFNTLAIAGHKPDIIVNRHGNIIFTKENFLRANPKLDWLYTKH